MKHKLNCRKIPFLLFSLVLIVLAMPVSAEDTNISLDFNSLPSAQGWFFNDGQSGVPETTGFSLSGGMLHMDTINTGVGYTGYSYMLYGAVNPQASFVLTVTARVSDYIVQSNDNPWGFMVGVYSGTEAFVAGISPARIVTQLQDITYAIDVTQFHEYRLVGQSGSFEFFVDNVSYGVFSSSLANDPNMLYVGDGTGGANAKVEISAFSFYQDIVEPTCSINAPASVYEGAVFTATVECDDVDNVYGFQLGTSASGDASTSASSYIPGTFVTDVGSDYLSASNSLSNYSVSRRAPATAASGSFTLGSIDFTANSGLTANGSATLTINSLLLGDIYGAALSVPIVNSTSVTILDLLSLNLTVASDGTVQQVRDVTASVDALSRGPQTGSGTSLVLNFTDVIATASPVLSADMKSHLQCSGSLNLTTSVTNLSIHLKAGDVVLNAADANPRINLFDAVTIGLAFGSVGTAEEDVNGDGTVNIFDLIHVGRNYGAVIGLCS